MSHSAPEPGPALPPSSGGGTAYAADTIVPGASTAPSAEASRAERRRAAEEAERAAQATSRRRLLMVSGAVLALLAVIALVWSVMSRSSDQAAPAPQPSASATGSAQPTLLLQVHDKENIAVDNALLSVGGPLGRTVVVTIPSTTVMDVATGGALPFGQIARLPDASSSASALSDATGANVDATLSMDTLAFAGLVDAVGGVKVDVDVDVVTKQADGTSVILVPAGKQQLLQAAQAAAYATYLAPAEPESARLARFTQVLRQVVAQLPTDATKVEAIFTSLGASSRATVPTAQVAAFFERMHYDVIGDDVVFRTLPVKDLPSGYRVDYEAASAMVLELLPDAARKPGPNSKVRVLVQNGNGSPGLNTAARQLLVDAGYTFINGQNAPTLGQPTTAIIVPDETPDSLKWGSDIAATLKVPATAVQVATSGQTVADVIVVLGGDFKPTAK